MILCDTNILIEFYKGNPQVLEVLSRVGPSNLAISAVTVGELYYGAMNRRELRKIQNHLALLRQVPLDEDISDLFLSLMNAYTLSHNLSIPEP